MCPLARAAVPPCWRPAGLPPQREGCAPPGPQVFYNNQWGTVCDDDFTDTAASVRGCQALRGARACCVHTARPQGCWQVPGTPLSPRHRTVDLLCLAGGVHPAGAGPLRDRLPLGQVWAGVRPGVAGQCEEGRLHAWVPAGRKAMRPGRWHTHGCTRTARCHALGCAVLWPAGWGRALAARPPSLRAGGTPSPPRCFAQVECTGSEARLEDCPHLPWGKGDCDHTEDVGGCRESSLLDWRAGWVVGALAAARVQGWPGGGAGGAARAAAPRAACLRCWD